MQIESEVAIIAAFITGAITGGIGMKITLEEDALKCPAETCAELSKEFCPITDRDREEGLQSVFIPEPVVECRLRVLSECMSLNKRYDEPTPETGIRGDEGKRSPGVDTKVLDQWDGQL